MKSTPSLAAICCLLVPIAALRADGEHAADPVDRAAHHGLNDRSYRFDLADGYDDRLASVNGSGQWGYRDYQWAYPDDAAGDDAASGGAAPVDDDIWTRERLTGNWGGLRTDLEAKGVKLDAQVIQYYQGVASGGANTNFAYGGNVFYHVQVDGDKLFGLKGLFVNLRARGLFGQSINSDAGGFSLPNTTMLYPLPDEHKTAITGLLVMQALSKNIMVAGGKIDVLDFWTMVYPRMGGGVDGFQNLNMLAAALPWLRYVNLSVNGGGVLVLRDDGQIQGGVLVFDLNNSTTTVGLKETFNDGVGLLGVWRFFFDVDDKPARLLFAAGGATRAYATLEESNDGGVGEDGGGLDAVRVEKETGAWTAAVYYDQVLWRDPDNHKRDLWFFSGVSVGPDSPAFSKWNVFASVEATGMCFGREKDKVGIGGFFNAMSHDLKRNFGALGLPRGDMWGAEVYYNAEITPWFHLTGDVQVVQSQIEDDDPAIIVGLRGVLDL